MDVTKILNMIRECPGIRTVQISDRLDCDIQELQEYLRILASNGRVRSADVTGPNGRKATAWFDAGYVPPSAPVQADKPMPPGPAAEKVNITQLMIDFIRERGSASNSQLRQLIKDHSSSPPAALLAHVAKKGSVKLNAGLWKWMGEGVPSSPVDKQEVAPTSPVDAGNPATESASAVSPEVHEIPAAAPAKAAAKIPAAPELPAFLAKGEEWTFSTTKTVPAPADADFECAIWSDGRLQMTRDGAELAMLTTAEARKLCEYLIRVGVEVEA